MVFVWLFYHFLSACSNERWGDGCSNECNCEDEEEQCHHINGGCLSGCKAGSKGDGCEEGTSEGNCCLKAQPPNPGGIIHFC